MFGTIDSWVVWNLTGGANGGLHITDVTNASRTQLMRLDSLAWDDEMLKTFSIPRVALAAYRVVERSLRRDCDRAATRRAHRGHSRRPAGRAGRADLLPPRRSEEHVRHRLLHADEHWHEAGVIGRRARHYGRVSARQPTCALRARRLDRDCRRARAMAARQPRDHREEQRRRGARGERRGQWRRLHRARVLRPLRAVLERHALAASSQDSRAMPPAHTSRGQHSKRRRTRRAMC